MKKLKGGLIVIVLGLALLAFAARFSGSKSEDKVEASGEAGSGEEQFEVPSIDLQEHGETARATFGMG